MSENLKDVAAYTAAGQVEIDPARHRAQLNELFGTAFPNDKPMFSCIEAWALEARRRLAGFVMPGSDVPRITSVDRADNDSKTVWFSQP